MRVSYKCRRAAPRRAALAERFPDVADCEDGQKAGDARAYSQLGQFFFVQMRHFVDRKLGFASQQFNDPRLIGLSTLGRDHPEGLGN